MHVGGQRLAFAGAGVVPVFQGDGQAFLEPQGKVLVRVVVGVAPEGGQLEKDVVVGREAVAASFGQGAQRVEHGPRLRGVEILAGGRGFGIVQGQAYVHSSPGGKAAHDFFKPRFKAAHGGGQTPLDIQMPSVDAFDVPYLGETPRFGDATSEPRHAAKHRLPSFF